MQKLVTLLHGVKWVLVWFIASHAAAVWMAYNDAEPHFTPIPNSQLNVSYAALNKYGNDTSGCPKKPTDTITVRYVAIKMSHFVLNGSPLDLRMHCWLFVTHD